ncbi:MAG: zinc ribbon domain-containing protein [Chloroflexota bacterium]
MKSELAIFTCASCATRFFPAREVCPNCGGMTWREEAAPAGVVEQVTTVRHIAGKRRADPIWLASVRLGRSARDPLVIARLNELTVAGHEVLLHVDEGGIVAVPARA